MTISKIKPNSSFIINVKGLLISYTNKTLTIKDSSGHIFLLEHNIVVTNIIGDYIIAKKYGKAGMYYYNGIEIIPFKYESIKKRNSKNTEFVATLDAEKSHIFSSGINC